MSYTRTELRPVVRDSIIPRFHIEAVEDPVATAAAGHPCFRSEERVQFLVPGSPNQPVERVNDGHRQRWPEQYASFKKGEDMASDGMPLEHWPLLKKPQVYELKAMNIHTVEQCAELADTAVQKINFGHRLRELARAYLDDAAALALTQKQSAEIEKQNSEIAELRQKVSELSSLVNSLHHRQQVELDRPSAVATYIPGAHDPISVAQAALQVEASESAMASIPEARRRGARAN